MSKERLEEIVNHKDDADRSNDEYEYEKVNFYNMHDEWLIERVQELEENAQDLRKALGRRQEQNKRYRDLISELRSFVLRGEDECNIKQLIMKRTSEALEGEE